MFEKFNPCFCKYRHNLEACASCKRKRCPTLSNFVYGYIINPMSSLFGVIRYGCVKCTSSNKRCSFNFCGRCSVSKQVRKNCK